MTTLGDLAEGDQVNLKIDVLARYLKRMQSLAAKGLSEAGGALLSLSAAAALANSCPLARLAFLPLPPIYRR